MKNNQRTRELETTSREQIATKRQRVGAVQNAMLSALAMSGAILVLSVAPALPAALASICGAKRMRAFQSNDAFKKLVAQGLVEFIDRPGKKKFVQITTAGYLALGQIQPKKASFWKKRTWDKRWRVIIFDIPEKKSMIRSQLRALLKRVGFLMVQQSVWVYPYDCEQILTLIRTHLNVRKEALYLVVESMDRDEDLRSHFGLA